MSKKGIKVDSDLLFKCTMKEFKLRLSPYDYINLDDPTTWSQSDKELWKQLRACEYYRLRKEASLRANDFWLNKADSGVLQDILKKYGFKVDNKGNVRCIDAGKAMLKSIMEQIIIPEIEETTGIIGIKVKKNAGPCAENCLCFNEATIKE